MLLILFFIVLLASIAESVVYVDIHAPAGGNGNTWCTAYNTIQAGLNDADVLDEEVWVADGTYFEHIILKEGVALYGGFTGCRGYEETERDQRNGESNLTAIDGDYSGTTAVVMGANNAIIDGFTIQNGMTHGYGSGMLNVEASPIINRCIFRGNGGAFWGYGGGICNIASDPIITNCTFSFNGSEYGGGIWTSGGSVTITDCTFSANSGFMEGGGIWTGSGSVSITNCIFSENISDSGGGAIQVYRGSASITNCTFSGNRSTGGAGGIYNSGTLTLTNCTFSENRVDMDGSGGIYNADSSPVITNCIFWGNDPYEILNNGSSSPIVRYCNIAQDGYEGINGNIRQDPLFVDPGYWDDNGTPSFPYDDFLVDGDYHIQYGSPCIDTGTNQNAPTDDIDGEPRSDGAVDIGADEYVDTDSDIIADYADNCPNVYNPGQEDADGDGIGNACDLCPNDPENDIDSDGTCADIDNCPSTPNEDQSDTYPPQGNGIGDACDCEGNFNCYSDSDVDGSDAALFKKDFGRSMLVEPCTSESPCNGDFNCDGDADGTDASLFKADFGRSSMQKPCPACIAGVAWCSYPLP
jgi:hypothetical protein